MNPTELQTKLIVAARLQKPDDRVPYAFEHRVMALIAARKVVDRWAFGLWRAALSCAAVAVVCGTLSVFLPASVDSRPDLSQDFENTLLASLDQGDAAP